MLPAAHEDVFRLSLDLLFEFSEFALDDRAFQRFVIFLGGAFPALLNLFENLAFQF